MQQIWDRTVRNPSQLVSTVVGLLLAFVLLVPGLVLSDVGRRTQPPSVPTANLPGPGFAVYSGSASEPIRFVVNRATNVLAVVPGGLLYDWQEQQGQALTRVTFGDHPVEPEVDRLSASGTGIETIRYREVWPGVDLVVRTTLMGIAYNFVLQPGVDPSTVMMSYGDVDSLELGEDGRLQGQNAQGAWTSGLTESWQDGPEGREPVASNFVLLGGGRYGNQVGPYDLTRPLTIDPPME